MLNRRASALLAALPFAISIIYGQSSSQSTVTHTPSSRWATQGGVVMLRDFRFGSGETLPELRLHYLTLGTPHRNAGGNVDNAILLLHGTGGNAHSLLNPIFSDVLFVAGLKSGVQKMAAAMGKIARPSTATDLLTLAVGMILGFLIGAISSWPLPTPNKRSRLHDVNLTFHVGPLDILITTAEYALDFCCCANQTPNHLVC